MINMDSLLSPESPELDVRELTRLAGFAKHLGKAPLQLHNRPQSGAHLTRMKGHGMEMLEVRQYHNNDELRHIDWRVSARTGTTHTRVYAEEKEHSRLLVLTLSSAAYFGTKDTFISTRMVQLQTLIAWRTKLQNDKVGAYLQFGEQQYFLPVSNKGNHINNLLSHFANATRISHRYSNSIPATKPSPWKILQKHATRQQQIIICSDSRELSNDELTQLQILAKHNTIHWIAIEDSRLAELPEGKYCFEDIHGSKTIYANRANIESSNQQKQRINLDIRHQLNQIGVTYHWFALHESPVQMARQLLFCGALS